jgi:hypothetical protein
MEIAGLEPAPASLQTKYTTNYNISPIGVFIFMSIISIYER